MAQFLFKNPTWLMPLALLAAVAFAAVALLGGERAAADPHSAADYFIFSKAVDGQHTETPVTDCDGSNDKQADVSGSDIGIFGRIHSNADIALSGQTIEFHDPLTFGKFDGGGDTCQVQADDSAPAAGDCCSANGTRQTDATSDEHKTSG